MRRWVIEYGWFLMMGLIITALGFIAYEVHDANRLASEANRLAAEANRNTAENNHILKARDFQRLFGEHDETQQTVEAIKDCACGEGRADASRR